jgi:hypothetical protein
MLSMMKSSVMWIVSVYLNMWTTVTAGQQCVLSAHSVQFVLVMSPVLRSFLRNVCLLITVHQSQIQYQFCDVLFYKFSLCSRTKCTSAQLAKQQTKHSLALQRDSFESVFPDLSYVTALTRNRLNCCVEDRHKCDTMFTKWCSNPYSRIKDICFCSRIALTNSGNVCVFLSSPTDCIWMNSCQ